VIKIYKNSRKGLDAPGLALLRRDDWFKLKNSNVWYRTHRRQLFSRGLLDNAYFLESRNYTRV
jgi:hypothetical protein